jgi:hypothetical protein
LRCGVVVSVTLWVWWWPVERFRGHGRWSLPGVRAAVIAAVAGRVLLRGVRPGGGGQPLAAASVLSFWKAASSSSAHGQVFWRWSLPRRPENAIRPATCSSR